MKRLIIFATGNKDKIREIREIITDPQTRVVSMKEAGVAADPEEDGTTFEENALIKARAVADLVRKNAPAVFSAAGAGLPEAVHAGPDTEVLVMSDDSGLVIDALDGMPGIYSARYLGHETSYTYKMNVILEKMKDVPDPQRTARFVAAVAAVRLGFVEDLVRRDSEKQPSELVVRGTMEGAIDHTIRGEHGFGYDPFFLLPELGVTSAQLTDEQKNAVSHRGKAIRAMLTELEKCGW